MGFSAECQSTITLYTDMVIPGRHWDSEAKRCDWHNCELVSEGGQLYCKECLHASYLTYQAQLEGVRRYRQSEKGKEAEKRYEQSEKGKVARTRYIESEKNKQRRREYNQRLQESLRIAREALPERATREKVEEMQRTDELVPLAQDVHGYIDAMGIAPTPATVVAWALEAYGTEITTVRAIEVIRNVEQGKGGGGKGGRE